MNRLRKKWAKCVKDELFAWNDDKIALLANINKQLVAEGYKPIRTIYVIDNWLSGVLPMGRGTSWNRKSEVIMQVVGMSGDTIDKVKEMFTRNVKRKNPDFSKLAPESRELRKEWVEFFNKFRFIHADNAREKIKEIYPDASENALKGKFKTWRRGAVPSLRLMQITKKHYELYKTIGVSSEWLEKLKNYIDTRY